MKRLRWDWLALAGILLLALALRWTGLDWDGYEHYHPDERYITWVATTVEWPTDLATAFDPVRSPFNPYYWPPGAVSPGIEVLQDQPRKFAYGHLPLYGGVVATRLLEAVGGWLRPFLPTEWLLTRDVLNGAEWVEFRHLTAVSRALTGLVDVATAWLVFLLGRRLYGTAVGLLGAFFLAVNVMHIQLAHFFISDPYLTFFGTAAIYLMVVASSSADGYQPRAAYGAAICVGLAVGSKFGAVLLLLPLALTVWLGNRARFVGQTVALGLVTFSAFFVTNPFAVLDHSCELVTPQVQLGPVTVPAIDWRSCYLDNIVLQSRMVRGELNAPFTFQYDGTTSFLYYLEMQVKAGMGPLLAVPAFLGLVWALWQLLLAVWRRQASSQLVIFAFLLPFFLSTGSFFVKFMRYLQPMTPFLMVYGAALLWQLRWRWLRLGLAGLVGLGTAVYALAFVNLYQQEHPWTTASKWVYANVTPGTLILSEQWDDALPTTLLLSDGLRRRSEYRNAELTWLTGSGSRDNEAKLDGNLALLAEAEYLTLMSNRVYGVVPRTQQRFPVSSQYHQLLLDGKLGYEVVVINGRFPHLGSLRLVPDSFGWPRLTPPAAVGQYLHENGPSMNWGRLDESFTVYDQPLTIIMQNTGKLSAAEMKAQFRLP